MVNIAIFLLVLAIALALAEMFAPGFGFFGISSIVSFICAFAIIILNVPYGIYIVLTILALLVISANFAVKYIKKRQLYGKLILDETLNEAKKELGGLEFFIGKEGVAKTPLKPFGIADFNSTSLEVCSDGAYIKENSRIKVVEVTNSKVIVRQLGQYQ